MCIAHKLKSHLHKGSHLLISGSGAITRAISLAWSLTRADN
jgi:hypothetical protein